jgi:hypothetical protein
LLKLCTLVSAHVYTITHKYFLSCFFLLPSYFHKALAIISSCHQIKQTEIPSVQVKLPGHAIPFNNRRSLSKFKHVLSFHRVEDFKKPCAYRFHRFFPPHAYRWADRQKILELLYTIGSSIKKISEIIKNERQDVWALQHTKIERDKHLGVEVNQIFIPWSVSLWWWYYTKNTGKWQTNLIGKLNNKWSLNSFITFWKWKLLMPLMNRDL